MKQPKFIVVDVYHPGAIHVEADNDAICASEAYENAEHNMGTVPFVLSPEVARKLGEALIKVAEGGTVDCEANNGFVGNAELYDGDWEENEDEEMEDEDDDFKNWTKFE